MNARPKSGGGVLVTPVRLQGGSRLMDQCINSRIGKGLAQTVKPQEENATPGKLNDSMVEESSLHLDYELMVKSSALAEVIRETAAQIEENMIAPVSRQIDMTLIEALKQRRQANMVQHEGTKDPNIAMEAAHDCIDLPLQTQSQL